MLKNALKTVAVQLAMNPLVMKLFAPLRKKYVPVFMLHRMQDESRNVTGHSPEFLRKALSFLKENNFTFISLDTLLSAIDGETKIPPNAIVFTCDDGFYDQAEIAVPIFQAFDCPVTIFLLSDFMDGKGWPWDYQVEYIIKTTNKTHISMTHDLMNLNHSLSDKEMRHQAIHCIREKLKQCSTRVAEAYTQDLAAVAEVAIENVPDSYEPISWDRAKQLEGVTVKFGAHSVRHSILARQDEATCLYEVTHSRERLKQELQLPSDVFCYPTGRKDLDFNARDMHLVKSQGYSAALSTTFGYVNVKKDGESEQRYCLKRLPFPDNLIDLIQYSSWIECLKGMIRGS